MNNRAKTPSTVGSSAFARFAFGALVWISVLATVLIALRLQQLYANAPASNWCSVSNGAEHFVLGHCALCWEGVAAGALAMIAVGAKRSRVTAARRNTRIGN